MTRRQCTSEYKTNLLERYIRYEILGLRPYQPAPPNNGVIQLIGLSYDGTARIIRVKARYQAIPWEVEFPLWDMQMTRRGCETWLKKWYPTREVPRSACSFCPYHSDLEWKNIRDSDPKGWAEALRIDEGLRDSSWACTRGMRQQMFLHDSRKPLAEVDLHEKDERTAQSQFGFLQECDGMCST
jgi:hypothetical protein